MNEKDKIILKDGTELEIEQSSSTGTFTMEFANMGEFQTTVTKLNQANLEAYQVQNQEGLTITRPHDKECLHCDLRFEWDDADSIINVTAYFNVTEVDKIAKAVREMQGKQAVQDKEITNSQVALTELYEGLGV